MLKKLTPRELEVGMIAVDAIVTPSGQILAPAGSTLTRQLINKAKLYNVPLNKRLTKCFTYKHW